MGSLPLHRSFALLCLSLFALLNTAPALRAADPGREFFEKKIRPILVEHCYRCHSMATKQRGGLTLDSRDGLRKGGDSGPVVVPGKPNDEPAPASRPLRGGTAHAAQGQAARRRHRRPGEVDRDGRARSAHGRGFHDDETASTCAAGRRFWAFQPPRRHPLPKVKDASWPRGDIDSFLLAALEAKGLRPAADADRRRLLRRRLLRPHRPAADARSRSTPSSATARQTPSRRSSTTCWPRRTSASAGAGTGSTWPAIAESSGGGRSLLVPGRLALSRLRHRRLQRATCRTIASSSSKSPATCCPPPRRSSGAGS